MMRSVRHNYSKSRARRTKMIKQVQAPKQMQASKQVQRIPYVAAKVAVVKSNQVATKVKDGITEVRDMFQKVDSAFKKRKEDSQLLAMAISDSENHFAYLESQTQEQVKSTSALALALSSRQEQIEGVSRAVEDFEAQGLEDFRSLFDEMKIATEQVANVGQEMKNELTLLERYTDEQIRFVETVKSSLEEYMAQDVAEEIKVASIVKELEHKLNERTTAEEKLKQAQEEERNLTEAIAASRDELPRQKDKLLRLEDSHSQQNILLGRLKNRVSEFTGDIAVVQTNAEKHLVAFEAQNSLREEEIAALAATFQEKRAHRDAKYQELQALQKQKGQLESDVTSAATALSSLTTLQEQERTALEDTRTEVQQLEHTVQQTRVELQIAHQTATQATKDNEEHYQLTCARMTALRGAHCLQSTLSQSKHVLEEKLSARVRDLQGAVRTKIAAAEQEQQLQREDEAQLEATTQSVSEVQAALAELRVQCSAQSDQLQTQQAEESRLTALQSELAAQVATQQELERKKEFLEQARAQQRATTDSAAEALRGQQQELERLERFISEAKMALKKKQANGAPTESQQQLHEVDVEKAIAAMSTDLQAKHAAEIASVEDCRTQLARGFPEQKERAAMEIQTKAAEVESQRQRLHSTQQAILQVKEQLQQQTEKQHAQRVLYLQQHRSVSQLQDLQMHLHSELSTATHNTTSNDPTNTTNPTTTHRSMQLQRTLAAVAEALTYAEAMAMQAAQEQEQQQAAALALAQAQAQAEAEADALATARANELANSALHGDDVFPFDLADEIHSIGPPKSALDPLPAFLPGATFDTVTSTITCSNMTNTFQSPAETFPVSYAAGSNTGILVESAVLTETVVPVAVAAKVTKTAKAKGKRKATQSAEPLQQDSSPPATQVIVAVSTPIADGLMRWERSQPTASHQLPPRPPLPTLPIPPVQPDVTSPLLLSLPTSLPALHQAQTQQSRQIQQQHTNGIAAALSPLTENSAAPSMDLFDEMSIAPRRATTITTTAAITATATATATINNNNSNAVNINNNSSSISTTSTPEEIRAARRREKNKAHKQKQKERNKTRSTSVTATAVNTTVPALTTTANTTTQRNDDVSVQSEDHSWDLLKAYPPVQRTSNTNHGRNTTSNTAATAAPSNTRETNRSEPTQSARNTVRTTAAGPQMRPPLHKETTSTARVVVPTSRETNSSWDIFGLPPVATILLPPASSKKYSSKSAAQPTAKPASATTTVTSIIPATPSIPASSLSDKRKYGQISNTVQTNTASTTSATDFAVPTGQPSAKNKKALSVAATAPAIAATAAATTTTRNTTQAPPATLSTSRNPSTSAGLNRARSTSSTYPTTTSNSVPARTTSNSAPTVSTVLNKKKNKTVVTKDWFDEDAPF